LDTATGCDFGTVEQAASKAERAGARRRMSLFVIASEARQSSFFFVCAGLPHRFAPRKDDLVMIPSTG